MPLYIAQIGGSNTIQPYARSLLGGTVVGITADHRDGGIVRYGDGPSEGLPVLFESKVAAREAAAACHWSGQRYAVRAARGHVRRDGVVLRGDPQWTSCQDA